MYLTTLIYGGYLIAMGQMQAADLAMYALYIGIFISPIQILVELVEMLQKGLSGFRRYLEVVETEPEIQDKEGAIDLENLSTTATIIKLFSRKCPFTFLQENPLHLSVLPAVAKQQSAPCCLVFTM